MRSMELILNTSGTIYTIVYKQFCRACFEVNPGRRNEPDHALMTDSHIIRFSRNDFDF